MNTDWNLMNSHSSNEVPKVADFLGVGKSENQSDLAAFNEIHQSNDSGYLFTNNTLVPMQNSVVATSANNFDYQESNNNNTNAANSNLQSLTLSMGSGNTNKDSTCETSGDNTSSANNTAVEPAAPRRTLDTFGQRTSIYRGVTR